MCWSSDRLSNSGKRNLGRVARLSGQSRVPEPPAGITAQNAPSGVDRSGWLGTFGGVPVDSGKALILNFSPMPQFSDRSSIERNRAVWR